MVVVLAVVGALMQVTAGGHGRVRVVAGDMAAITTSRFPIRAGREAAAPRERQGILRESTTTTSTTATAVLAVIGTAVAAGVKEKSLQRPLKVRGPPRGKVDTRD